MVVAVAVVAASGTGVVEMAEAPSSTVGGTAAGTVRGVPAMMMNTAATTTMKIPAAMAGAAAGAAGAVMTARVGGGVAPP